MSISSDVLLYIMFFYVVQLQFVSCFMKETFDLIWFHLIMPSQRSLNGMVYADKSTAHSQPASVLSVVASAGAVDESRCSMEDRLQSIELVGGSPANTPLQ